MLPRRLFLGAGVGLGVAALTACGASEVDLGPIGGDTCRSPEALESFSSLAGAPLSYADSGNRQSFQADPKFIVLLEEWATAWVAAAGLGPLVEVSTYGAHVDKCPSWHAAGRAFDIEALVHEGGTVSCRYDQWGEDPQRLRNYWRLAASLSTRFTYTLGYPYNAAHHNHLHVDNGVNGYEPTRFKESSGAQTMVLQGTLRHVFGAAVEVTGTFDEPTREAARTVQREQGITDRLSTEPGWRAFLEAALTQPA